MAVKTVIYESPTCPYCHAAKALLVKREVAFETILVDGQKVFDEMMARSGRDTVPQIFIGEHHVGGYDDLVELDMDGELEPLLAS